MACRHYLVIILLFACTGLTQAQKTTLNSFTNRIFLNSFTDKPDTTIIDFLRLYIPSVLEKKNIAAGGTTNRFSPEIHSFVFTQHPYLPFSFTSGRIDMYCQRFADARGVRVYDTKLCLEFDQQQEAEIAFSKLIETYLPISTKKNIGSKNGYQFAEFSDTAEKNGFSKVQFKFTSDNLNQNRYKILLETTNSL